MAGLKKPSRKKDNPNPNIVLIIFMVFFVLLSIGLGIFAYYGNAGQEKLLADAKAEKTNTKAAKDGLEYRRVVGDTLLLAFGQELPEDEKLLWREGYKEFNKADGLFKNEKTREDVKKFLDELKAKYGFDEANDKFASNFLKINDDLKTQLDAVKVSLAKTEIERKSANEQFAQIKGIVEKNWDKAGKDIEKGNNDALAASRAKSVEVANLIESNKKLNAELAAADAETGKLKEKLDFRIRELEKKVADATNEKKVEVVSQTRNPNDIHALLLDVSRGKVLWDQPLGKISRVDMGARTVTINLGSQQGVKPELTFMVFGPGPFGNAEKHLKGTVEVFRVLDGQTSLARITSLYDSTGQEVPLTGAMQTRIQQQSESALRDGDLLFNMFWHQHIALAGPVSLTGAIADSPAEQMRQLSDVIHYLERLGMPVDSYLDLNDGSVKGTITSKTRYLIRGDDLPVDDKGAQADRVKAVNEAMQAMRKDATERGLFQISGENFLGIIGYRRPRSLTDNQLIGFRPSQPVAGSGLAAGAAPAAAPAPPAAPAEQKGPAMEKEN